MTAYNALDRLLHRLALQVTPVAELSFDLDQRLVDTDPDAIVNERHVFVSGLARAGTTALMRGFHDTGAFRSLTYRDMPFVLAPNLWRRLTGTSNGMAPAAERAHGDGVLVDADSPESLDEVFWRIFAGAEYIGAKHLSPHVPDQELTTRYVSYVNAILKAQDGSATRYLCKNNNNILRLDAIRRAFPNAVILIPFREPLSQAASLLRQHENFSKQQQDDAFVGAYMSWLVHHEFGRDHRPFRYGDGGTGRKLGLGADAIDYWLDLWAETYEWLEGSAPKDAVFVCYEDLCRDSRVWTGLTHMAGLAANGEADFRLSNRSGKITGDGTLMDRASVIYDRLRNRGRSTLKAA